MMDISFNPRVDIAFKKIFGVEENKDLLMSLLNSIISEEDQIDEIELLNPYNERNFKRDKLSVLDIKARNKRDKTHFLIEMQLADELDYHKRGLYSWARVYSNQLSSSDKYKNLSRTIAIHILNFTFIDYSKVKGWDRSAPNKYHHRFVLKDKETNIEIFKDIEIHTIELQKFAAINSNDLAHVITKIKGALDKWIAFLTQYNLLNSIKKLPVQINTPEIKKALKVMQEMSMSRDERDIYDSHLDFLRIEESVFAKKFEEYREKGKAEGIKAGREEGMREGKAEERLEMAKALLSEGLSIDMVSKVTGFTTDELKKLQELVQA